MVTKLMLRALYGVHGSVLAKIHMVTKPSSFPFDNSDCSVLAKIHMVTKRDKKISESSSFANGW